MEAILGRNVVEFDQEQISLFKSKVRLKLLEYKSNIHVIDWMDEELFGKLPNNCFAFVLTDSLIPIDKMFVVEPNSELIQILKEVAGEKYEARICFRRIRSFYYFYFVKRS